MLTKEKIDKQRTGQSSTSPFMKVSQEGKRSYEKEVTFDALGTIERYSNSIDKLTSLVSKMNIKMDKKEPSTKQEYIKVETEDMVIDRIIIDPGKGHRVAIMLSTVQEEEIIVTVVTGLIIKLEVDQEMTMEVEGMTGLIIDKVTEERISDKIMENKDIEQEEKVKIKIGPDNNLGTSPEEEIKVVEARVEIEGSSLGMFQEIDQNQSPWSRSSSHVSTNRDRLRLFRCSEYNHFARECPNTMTEDDLDQEDFDSATLQMLSQDDSLNYAEVEGLNM